MKKKLFKFLTLSFSSLILGGYATVPFTSAQANEIESVSSIQFKELDQETLISKIEPFVKVDEFGEIGFTNELPNLYRVMYDLDKLQLHFDNLNNQVEDNNISINEDLSISYANESAYATYGKWTYYWWGYDRNFGNSEAGGFANYCFSVAAGAGIVGGVGAWLPPIAAITSISAGYWSLLGSRINANNNGRGVYVGITWAVVFNIKPL